MTPSTANDDNAESLAELGRIGFIGAGALGTTLARTLAAHSAQVVAIAARHPERAQTLVEHLPEGMAQAVSPEQVVATCDMVLLAVPDDAIAPLASSLPWRAEQSVVHFSGAKPAAALAACREQGAHIAALHPLMTFPHIALDDAIAPLSERLRGCYWALEAEDTVLHQQLAHLVTTLHGTVISLDVASRIPYHIAAVFASNYIVALLGAASALWENFGVGRDEALQALLPLTRAAVDNLAEHGLPQALSGPVARGDAGTLAAHLDWLAQAEQTVPDNSDVLDVALVAAMYRPLAQMALALALEKQTITPEQAAAIEQLLTAPHPPR